MVWNATEQGRTWQNFHGTHQTEEDGFGRMQTNRCLPQFPLNFALLGSLHSIMFLQLPIFFYHQPTQSFSANGRLWKAVPQGLPVTGAWAVLVLFTGSTWTILATKGELFAFFPKSAKEQEAMFNCCLPKSDAHSPLLVGVFPNNGNKSDVM